MTCFVQTFFGLKPHYANEQFVDFVFPNGFRIAFFLPVGKAAQWFSNEGTRHFTAFGVTTPDVDAAYARSLLPEFQQLGVTNGGPPKDHPWGERSFLLVDPDGNRWEVTQSPSESGMLVNR